MRIVTRLSAAAGAVVAAFALSASAHHSFPAQYDINKPVTLTGAVTKVEWMNPHALIYIDVKDEKTGQVTNWALELGSPNSLLRLGWTRDSLKAGTVVTVEGSRARDGSPLVNARSIVLAGSGKKLFAGSSQGNAR
jgi:DNA/RNA endonuclease YhcR with UshA esterase domain